MLSGVPSVVLSDDIRPVLRALLHNWRRETGPRILSQTDPSVLAEHTDEFYELLRDVDWYVR